MYDCVDSEARLNKISDIPKEKPAVLLSILDTLLKENIPKEIPKSKCKKMTEPIDAVYTWVNGSDPDFIRSMYEFQMETNNDLNKDMHSHRFEGLYYFNLMFVDTKTSSLSLPRNNSECGAKEVHVFVPA